jgi:hypothetical protein
MHVLPASIQLLDGREGVCRAAESSGVPMTDQGYNGWSNKPTWTVALWIDNDEGLSEMVSDLGLNDIDRDIDDLAQSLEEMISEVIEMIAPAVFDGTMVADLFGWSFAHVDWLELAEHYMKEVE